MTVKELREFLDWYCKEHSENDNVLLIDDGMKAEYFDIHSSIGTFFEREIKPAKIEVQKIQYNPSQNIDCNANEMPLSYCLKCKNYVEGSRKQIGTGMYEISCNNPRTESILKNVLEYNGSPCMDYDPIEPIYREVHVQIEPPEYKKENIVGLTFNKYYPSK